MHDRDTEHTHHKVTILVGYHKPSVLLKNSMLTPIHLGRDIVDQANKDGVADSDSQQWLYTHLIGDNTGSHISAKNRSYNEMTALYWAWKNLDQLDYPDYLGFMHYRRQFIFDDNMVPLFHGCPFETPDSQFRINTLSADDMALLFNEQAILNALDQTDVIIPRGIHWPVTVYEQYLAASGHAHQIRDLDVTLQVIKEEFAAYYPTAKDYMNGYTHYLWNMSVMRRDIFEQYCTFIFAVLARAEEVIQLLEPSMPSRTLMQQRIYGYLSERLSGIYFMYLKNQKQYRLSEKYSVLEMFLPQ